MNSGLKIQTILPFIDEYRSDMAWEIPNFQIEFLSTGTGFGFFIKSNQPMEVLFTFVVLIY